MAVKDKEKKIKVDEATHDHLKAIGFKKASLEIRTVARRHHQSLKQKPRTCRRKCSTTFTTSP